MDYKIQGMEELRAYLRMIDPRLLHHINGKPRFFIDLLEEQKDISEEEFEQQVCGDKYSESYYRQLKYQTIKVLQALVVVSEPRGTNLAKKKYEICQKKFLVGQKLIGQGQRKEGIELLKDAYKIAVNYDFSYFATELASLLFHHQVYFEKRNKKSRLKARSYAEAMKQYSSNYSAEKNMDYHFYNVISQITSSFTAEPIKEAIDQVIQQKGTSIRYHVFLATLYSIHGFHVGDYESIIKSCKETLIKLNGRKGVYNAQFFSFYKDIGVAQMAIGKYSEAEINYKKADNFVSSKSFNDYLLRFYMTMNAIRDERYYQAYEMYIQNQKCSNNQIRIQFAIIEAYLHFLVHTGYLKLDKPFRMRKYLNNTFEAQSDKRGSNINVTIAELLMLLAKDRGKFIDRVEAVKEYSYKHLKSHDTQRAKWFIRILCTLPRANFNPIALQRLARKQIENIGMDTAGQNFAIEIIPFQKLIDMILVFIQRKAA